MRHCRLMTRRRRATPTASICPTGGSTGSSTGRSLLSLLLMLLRHRALISTGVMILTGRSTGRSLLLMLQLRRRTLIPARLVAIPIAAVVTAATLLRPPGHRRRCGDGHHRGGRLATHRHTSGVRHRHQNIGINQGERGGGRCRR